MSIYLMAPHSLPEVTIRLPNPLFSDTSNAPYYTNIVRTMNGNVRTIIKTNSDTIIKQNFQLRRPKAQELYEFIRVYGAAEMRFIDSKDVQYFGYIINDPFSVQHDSRDDFTALTLEFRGRLFV